MQRIELLFIDFSSAKISKKIILLSVDIQRYNPQHARVSNGKLKRSGKVEPS